MNPRLEQIKELITKRQYLSAQKKSTELLKLLTDKDDLINCYLLLAESYARDIKNIKALEELNKAMIRFPYQKEILDAVYDLMVKLKRNNEAEQVLKDLLMSEPENLSYVIRLVRLYISKENYKGAFRELTILLSQGNYSPTINSLAAFCLEKMGMYSEQLKHVKLLQQMNPENYEMYFKEAEVLINLGEYDEAVNILNSCFETYQEVKGIDNKWVEKIIHFTKFLCDFGIKADLVKKLSLINFKTLNPNLKNNLLKTLKENKVDFYFINESIKEYKSNEIVENAIYYSDYFTGVDYKLLLEKIGLSGLENYLKFVLSLYVIKEVY